MTSATHEDNCLIVLIPQTTYDRVIARRNIIVIGASAGGVDTLKRLVIGLPVGLPAAVFITMHIPAWRESALPEILLAANGHFQASHPHHHQAIERGTIYVAPPDFHLELERGERVSLSHGPKEAYFRPAINPLFRSAAKIYQDRVVGVILTGALDDGVAGLSLVKSHGGVTVVQDPKEAVFPNMPLSALRSAPVDYVLPVSEMPKLFLELATGDS